MECYAREYFNLKDGSIEAQFPEYSIYGYDKDNDIFALYGIMDDKEDAVSLAKEYKVLLDDNKLLRFRPDMQGRFIPLDWVMVTKTFDEEQWFYNSYIQDYYEKNHLLSGDLTSAKEITYAEIQKEMMQENID